MDGLVQRRLCGACGIPKPVLAILHGAFRTASAQDSYLRGVVTLEDPIRIASSTPPSVTKRGRQRSARSVSTSITLWSGKVSARGMVRPAVQPTLLWYLTAALSCEKGNASRTSFRRRRAVPVARVCVGAFCLPTLAAFLKFSIRSRLVTGLAVFPARTQNPRMAPIPL